MFQNNPKALGNWKGEGFAIYGGGAGTLEYFKGQNSSSTYASGCRLNGWSNVLTQNKWHTVAVTLTDHSSELYYLALDGKYIGLQTYASGTGTNPTYTATGGVRWDWGNGGDSEDIGIALFQSFNRVMGPDELVFRTVEPLAMFWPESLRTWVDGNIIAAAERVVSIGGAFDRTSRVAYAG